MDSLHRIGAEAISQRQISRTYVFLSARRRVSLGELEEVSSLHRLPSLSRLGDSEDAKELAKLSLTSSEK